MDKQDCTTHLTMGVCNRGTAGCAQQHDDREIADAVRLLEQIVAPCEGADEHSWRKCKRCAAIHGLEMRFSLSMRVLNRAIAVLKQVGKDS